MRSHGRLRADNATGGIAAADASLTRYFDPRTRLVLVKVPPGMHYVSGQAHEVVATTLGSCVSACIRDTVLRVGGLNHFLLPDSTVTNSDYHGANLRYGCFAMERLINDILQAGGRRQRLEAKLFGGADLLGNTVLVGRRNCEFATSYLANEGIALVAHDLGGHAARQVQFHPRDGLVEVRRLQPAINTRLRRTDAAYRARLATGSLAGTVELFAPEES